MCLRTVVFVNESYQDQEYKLIMSTSYLLFFWLLLFYISFKRCDNNNESLYVFHFSPELSKSGFILVSS